MMGNKQNILLVNYEMTMTGSPKALLNLAFIYRKLGWNVNVWSFNDGPFKNIFIQNNFQIEIVSFEGSIRDKLEKFNLVIANTIFCSKFAVYSQNYVDTILYIMEADNISELIENCGLDKNDILAMKKIWCVSDYAQKCIAKHLGIKNVEVVPNYVKQEKAKLCLLSKRRKMRFVVSGTIEPRKGQDIALKAYLTMPEYVQEKCELHFVGEQPEWSVEYQKMLQKIKNDRVFFHERIENQNKLFEFYRTMDVFIVASRDESCSLVALEAAMLGKIVIISANTGAKYLFNKSFILPTDDVIALSKKMFRLVTNPMKYNSQGFRNWLFYKKYGSEKNTTSIIKQIMNKEEGKENG